MAYEPDVGHRLTWDVGQPRCGLDLQVKDSESDSLIKLTTSVWASEPYHSSHINSMTYLFKSINKSYSE